MKTRLIIRQYEHKIKFKQRIKVV